VNAQAAHRSWKRTYDSRAGNDIAKSLTVPTPKREREPDHAARKNEINEVTKPALASDGEIWRVSVEALHLETEQVLSQRLAKIALCSSDVQPPHHE
jgi:formiminotetrahydrofolate cyclodeaminase